MKMYASIVATPLWTDRSDNKLKEFRYGEGPILTTEEVAEATLRVIEEGKYTGGTVMLKTADEEKVVFQGAVKEMENQEKRGPTDLSRLEELLRTERGVPWKA